MSGEETYGSEEFRVLREREVSRRDEGRYCESVRASHRLLCDHGEGVARTARCRKDSTQIPECWINRQASHPFRWTGKNL